MTLGGGGGGGLGAWTIYILCVYTFTFAIFRGKLAVSFREGIKYKLNQIGNHINGHSKHCNLEKKCSNG